MGYNNDKDPSKWIIAQPNQIDNEFMEKTNSDFKIQDENMTTEVASVTTRTIVDNTNERDIVFDEVSNIPDAYRVDAKPWIERPFFVDQVMYTTTAQRFSVLSSAVRFLPGDIARSNPNLLNAFKMAALGRSDLVLNISMAGTIGHAGCLLAAVLPPMPSYPTDATLLINTALTGPHAFLFANEATSVVIPVPWYCNTDMMTLDMDGDVAYRNTADITSINGNYGTLVFIVMNPLAVSDNSAIELSVVVEACFKHLDMVIPTPRYLAFAPQSGSLNPVYDDYEKIMKHIGDANRSLPSGDKKVKRRFSKAQLLSIVSATTSLASAATQLMQQWVVSDALTEVIKLVPQAGLLSGLSSAIMPGLIGTVASKGTKLVGDVLDKGIGALRKLTGLHNPNEAVIDARYINTDVNFANMVDGKQYFEKLDPYANTNRVLSEHVFGTPTDEMDVTHITSKDQFIGTFTVSQEDRLGKLVWGRPISPFQGGAGLAADGIICSNNLELMHSLHRAWRGGLNIKIQSVMNNKQQVKLKVIKYYNPSTEAFNTQPVYATVVNAPSHLLEFTQGAQDHTVSLPYLCRNALCPRAEDTSAEGLIHGMYYIYVAQPLVSADGSPSSVEFNVYMSGQEDLQFYGYTTSNLGWNDIVGPLTPALNNGTLNEDDFIELPKSFIGAIAPDDTSALSQPEMIRYSDKIKKKVVADYALPPAFFDDPANYIMRNGIITHIRRVRKRTDRVFEPQSGPIQVMNEPQDQHPDLSNERQSLPIECTRLKPNINMRDIIRRMYKTEALTQEINAGATAINTYALSGFLYEKPDEFYYSPMGMVSRMYYGKTVGFKFRIAVTLPRSTDETATIDNIFTRVYYQPQTFNVNVDTATILGSPPNVSSYPPITLTSTIGEPPMPYQLTPVKQTSSTILYEFVIPDTSFYKFMGSPNKFLTFSGSTVYPYLSTADFGNLILEITNLSGDKSVTPVVELYVGLTDESRMGFHSIAPPFRIRKADAYYLGDATNPYNTLTNTVNPFMYYGSYKI